MEKKYTKHRSVLFEESLDAMKIGMDGVEAPYIADMTFGGGGHSCAMAELSESVKVYSVDQDPDALENGYKIIKEKGLEAKLFLNNMNYEQFPAWMKSNHPEIKLSGILMDLGVSSHHFDQFERGFSFREDAFLDMRMDYNNEKLYTAAEVLNTFDEEDIANIIFKYGEERLSRRIAKNIVEFRTKEKLDRTKQLEDIIFHSYPKHQRHGRAHPATRTFQALRIFVNRELEVLENTLQELFDILAPGGTLAVISFHSLEDRIAKHKFREIFQTDKNIAKILTKKPIYPSEEEIAENPRSRSAKLRIIQKLS
jgi:16S rRNA (cytosine1402-N4)-methyltransferase